MSEHEIMDAVYRLHGALLVVIAAIVIPDVSFRELWRRLLALSPLRRTVSALFINWMITLVFVLLTGIYDPAIWFILTDAASARVVLHQPAAKSQAIIGAAYMVQIMMHVVYLVSDSALAETMYWQVLMALAIVQLIVLGGWTIGHHWKRYFRRGWRGSAGLAGSAPEKGLVE